MGSLAKIDKSRLPARLVVTARAILNDTKIGDSVCVNGACLTCVGKGNNTIEFDLLEETLRKTNFIDIKPNEKVNLEMALRSDSRLGGHFVSGHVDGTGLIADRKIIKGDIRLGISADKEIMKYVVEKGSIAVDGVSLTISGVYNNSFVVYIIPHTAKATNLGIKIRGCKVNIETDILAKFVERFDQQKTQSKSNLTAEFLNEQGFI